MSQLPRLLLFAALRVVVANAQNSTSASQPFFRQNWMAAWPYTTWDIDAGMELCGNYYHIPWTKWVRKLKWMLITIIFPEFIFSKAVCELKDAVDDLYEMKKCESDLSWKVEFGWGCQRLYNIFHLFGHSTRAENVTVARTHEFEPHQASSDDEHDKADDHEGHEDHVGVISGAEVQSTQCVPNEPELLLVVEKMETEGTQPQFDVRPISTRRREARRFATDSIGRLVEQVQDPMDIDAYLFRETWVVSMRPSAIISWLVLSIVARAVSGLAVSQIEVAALAFSILAIATYVANLWKPKDIDVPIMLCVPRSGFPASSRAYGGFPKRRETTSFINFLFTPSRRPDGYQTRIPNDALRIMGTIPLISSLTAVSTMVFGGLHCIAWSFEFPSRTEVLLWRIASISSATLPCVALFGNLAIMWLIGIRKGRYRRFLLQQLHQLDKYPPSWWSSLTKHSPTRNLFEDFLIASQAPEICRWPPQFSKGIRRGLKPHELLQLDMDIASGEKACRIYKWDRENWDSMNSWLEDVRKNWRSLVAGQEYDMAKALNFVRQSWEYRLHPSNSIYGLHQSPHVANLWLKYEKFVSDKLSAEGHDIPAGSMVEYLLDRESTILPHHRDLEAFKKHYDLMSRSLTIFAGIVYSIARVALLIIAFTSLRSVPRDLYVTSWTRFMPDVS
ncbi:uncharacterized protein PAC_16865 [Phialocephala subalpina]|uniref:Uncharacterized protein n=1 Tax=Phialocephala subalpina TaxID=576137 RepID=A0A1L7XPJ4_9HELO|nr:uncharacterized protein PAC_16865 [Phialocephala subalpina]